MTVKFLCQKCGCIYFSDNPQNKCPNCDKQLRKHSDGIGGACLGCEDCRAEKSKKRESRIFHPERLHKIPHRNVR